MNITALEAIVYFSRNPDEHLTLEDMCHKWGGTPASVRSKIADPLRKGWFASQRAHDPSSRNGLRTLYYAGPELLRRVSP